MLYKGREHGPARRLKLPGYPYTCSTRTQPGILLHDRQQLRGLPAPAAGTRRTIRLRDPRIRPHDESRPFAADTFDARWHVLSHEAVGAALRALLQCDLRTPRHSMGRSIQVEHRRKPRLPARLLSIYRAEPRARRHGQASGRLCLVQLQGERRAEDVINDHSHEEYVVLGHTDVQRMRRTRHCSNVTSSRLGSTRYASRPTAALSWGAIDSSGTLQGRCSAASTTGARAGRENR